MDEETVPKSEYDDMERMMRMHRSFANEYKSRLERAWGDLKKERENANRSAVIRIQEFLEGKFGPHPQTGEPQVKGKYRAEGARLVLDEINAYAEFAKRLKEND